MFFALRTLGFYLSSVHISCLSHTLIETRSTILSLQDYLQVHFDPMRSFHMEFRNFFLRPIQKPISYLKRVLILLLKLDWDIGC
jgi:hypothetical protein